MSEGGEGVDVERGAASADVREPARPEEVGGVERAAVNRERPNAVAQIGVERSADYATQDGRARVGRNALKGNVAAADFRQRTGAGDIAARMSVVPALTSNVPPPEASDISRTVVMLAVVRSVPPLKETWPPAAPRFAS